MNDRDDLPPGLEAFAMRAGSLNAAGVDASIARVRVRLRNTPSDNGQRRVNLELELTRLEAVRILAATVWRTDPRARVRHVLTHLATAARRA